MIVNTNKWNKIRYSIHSFYYDLILSTFGKERERAIGILSPKDGDSILIVGAGTGLDLPYLKGNYTITATDITPAMLRKLVRRAEKLKMDVHSMEMNGQDLKFNDNTFDCVILNLILAVIPDPKKCMAEVERVLKPDGNIIVFDKFLADEQKPSLFRKGLNLFTSVLFSDVNRKFSDILAATDLKIQQEEHSLFRGTFKIYCLSKMKSDE